jgi:cytochrome c-type biogenesis protein CcmH/NrfF
VLSILVWWAIPAGAVVLATAVAAVSRRIRRAREDVGSLHRYQRARQVLERTQQPAAPVKPAVSPLRMPE